MLSFFEGLDTGAPVIDGDRAGVEASWRALRRDSAGQPCVVLFAGHGVTRGRVLYLPVHDSRPGDLPGSAIDVGRWLNEVEHGSDPSPVLFLLDVCGAGAATDFQVFQDVPEADRRSWVIAACAGDESAFGARFTQATARVLERLRLGDLDISPALPHVPVEAFADEIARELVSLDAGYPQTVVHSPRRAASMPVPEFFPNPAFSTDGWLRLRNRLRSALRELASEFDPGLDPVHFLTRASGRPHDDAAMTGCLFTGRTRELDLVRAWLASDEPLMLVTGSPGSGKSALLGVTVFLAHPQLAELSTLLTSRIPAQHRPQRRCPTLVAVHARHRSMDQVIASIRAQLAPEGTAPAAAGSDEKAMEELLLAAENLPEPVVLVLDAVDEASESARIVDGLLRELLYRDRADGRPLFRVLVGIRPPQAGNALLHDDTLLRDDAMLYEARDHGVLLDLDTSTSGEDLAEDLATYLSDVLSGVAHYGDEAVREPVARAVATAIARRPDRGTFLLASLFADFLRTGAPLGPEEAVALLPPDLPHLLELRLRATLDTDPWMRHLMVGLAQARGQGMPLELVVAATTAAAAAAHQELGALLPGRARELLAAARFYLRTTVDTDGRQLYRFFHESLVEHFRGTAADPDGLAVLLFEELLSAVPGQHSAQAPRWDLAAPYLLRHLMDHAAAVPGGSAVDQLFLDPEYLVRADHTAVWRAVHRAKAPTARRAGVAYRTAFGRFGLGGLSGRSATLEARRPLLRQELVTYGAAGIARRLDDARDALRPQWSTGLVEQSLLHVIDESDLGTSVSAVVLTSVDRRLLAVIGGADGSLQAWDVTPGPGPAWRHFSVPPTAEGGITHLAVADLAERSVIVSITDWNTVRLHDPATGTTVGETHLDGARVSASTAVGTGDETVLAVGRVTGEISVVGLLDEELGSVLQTADAGDTAVASLLGVESPGGSLGFHVLSADRDDPRTMVLRELDGRPVVLSTDGPRQEVRIHHSGSPAPLFSLVAYDRQLSAYRTNGETVQTITLPKDRALTFADVRRLDRHCLALTAHRDGSLRVWDLDVCPRSGHGQNLWHPVTVLGTVLLDGSELAVSADLTFGEVKAWDVDSGSEEHGLSGLGRLTHAAAVTVQDAAYVVTATRENELDTWNLADGTLESTIPLPDPVTALAALPYETSVRVVVGCADGTIQVRDSAAESSPRVLTGPQGPVTALTAFEADGETMLISVHDERHVCVWSLADDTLRQSLTLDRVGAIGAAGGRPYAAERSSGGGRVRVRDLLTGTCLGTVAARDPRAMTIAQVDGRVTLVAATKEPVLWAWDARSGEPLGSPAPVREPVHTITPHAGGVFTGSRDGQVAALRWARTANAAETRPTRPTVDVTHVLAWLPGELLCGDAHADGWELYTTDEWEGGVPPSHDAVCTRPMTATAAELQDALLTVLEPDGFEVVRLEAGRYEISRVNGVTDGGPWTFPAYAVYCHPEEGSGQ
ncbi:AAA family ATPase [Kitasatospora sp. NPDC059160]|uniref:AAA family ATPase n=1 Tax=Kitasatospora sp. NPDC059160 TaxID=3346748 RepID=UPI00368771D5